MTFHVLPRSHDVPGLTACCRRWCTASAPTSSTWPTGTWPSAHRPPVEVTVERPARPLLVRGTPLASLVLERAATLLAASGIRLLEPPVALPGIHEWMY